jgi:hypothetical protein
VGPRRQPIPAGHLAQLFVAGDLEGAEKVYVTKGEVNAMTLWQLGFRPAVAGTAGATTWRKAWSERLGDARCVVVLFDHDEAGRAGEVKVVGSLRRYLEGVEVRRAKWAGLWGYPEGVRRQNSWEKKSE